MPEGPEIKRAADQIKKALMGVPVLEVSFAFDHLRDYESLFAGVMVDDVETIGKAMLIRFSNGYSIYSHNQLYGKWYVRTSFRYPKTNRQLRLAIHNEKKSALLYSASDIEVMKDEEIHLHPFIAKAGPDVLSKKITTVELVEHMKSKAFMNRKWAGILLDQSFVAGIGNYLRSEVLFKAKMDPSSRPKDYSDDRLHDMARAIIDLSLQSYETGGITNDLALAEKLKSEGEKRSAYRHWVFNREGRSCRMDGTPILKTIAASRRLYYCPSCQIKEE